MVGQLVSEHDLLLLAVERIVEHRVPEDDAPSRP